MNRVRMPVAIAALALSAPSALADTIVVPSAKDNTLYDDFKGLTSNGSGEHFFAGNTASFVPRRGLIAFDIAGALPAGATIDSVVLTLRMSRSVGPSADVALHPVLADWGEGASDAPGEEGAGALAEPGDATWLHTFFDTDFWATQGGDFATSASAVTTVGGIGTYTWSSPEMVSDAQAWLDDGASNFGWLLLGDESGIATAKRFDSRENEEVSFRPVLTIDFTPGSDCPADLDGSGAVDFADILAVLSAWGTSGGPEDLDGSGVVDFGDLLFVLANWGPCR